MADSLFSAADELSVLQQTYRGLRGDHVRVSVLAKSDPASARRLEMIEAQLKDVEEALPAAEEAARAEAFAEVTEALRAEPDSIFTDSYADETKDTLVQRAKERSIPIKASATKDEVILGLRAADRLALSATPGFITPAQAGVSP